jgi:hypothetical protein
LDFFWSNEKRSLTVSCQEIFINIYL